MDWGTGDTPVVECLRLVKANRYPITCVVEKDYLSERSGVEESGTCAGFMRPRRGSLSAGGAPPLRSVGLPSGALHRNPL